MTKGVVSADAGIANAARARRNFSPGFENCYLMDAATQTGVRCTRRLTGEYVVTAEV